MLFLLVPLRFLFEIRIDSEKNMYFDLSHSYIFYMYIDAHICAYIDIMYMYVCTYIHTHEKQ